MATLAEAQVAFDLLKAQQQVDKLTLKGGLTRRNRRWISPPRRWRMRWIGRPTCKSRLMCWGCSSFVLQME